MVSVYQEFGDLPLQIDRAFWKKSVGGKAFFLSQLYQAGIPVPAGIILRSCPENSAGWSEVVEWWQRDPQPVAVRSSATDEDSDDLSFAGQYKTFLNITTEDGLRDAVIRCFASIGGSNGAAYREGLKDRTPAAGDDGPAMNVVIQKMIDPLTAGVYFSVDPTSPEAGWLIEWVDGLGDSLVSGERTPRRVRRENAADSAIAHVLLPVIERVERLLKFPVDLEWAIDRGGQPWILQARPITAQASGDTRSRAMAREIAKLSKRHTPTTSWDGHAFAEWSGIPSELSFSIWARAFGSRGALGEALRSFGYLGSGSQLRGSALERVLGRPYVNQQRMDELLFGESLLATDPLPRPHVKIARDRLTAATLLQAPMAAFYMARAAWRSSGSSQALLRACRDDYARESQARQLPNDPSMYQSDDLPSLLSRFEAAANDFADRLLHWPMVLILLVESSSERLRQLLTKSVAPDQVDALLQRSLGHALNSVTFEMDRRYQIACYNAAARADYLSQYGHRAVGELDLARPRWIERGDRAFVAPRRESLTRSRALVRRPASDSSDDTNLVSGFYRPLYVQEATRLREMLALRENWKHLVMRPYAHLRWMAVEIGRRTGLNDHVFGLRAPELRRAALGPDAVPRLRRLAELRIDRQQSFSDVHLPMVVTLDALRTLGDGAPPTDSGASRLLHGQSLSPGLVCCEVRVVRHPEDISTADWPDDTILVAEATDPGWTALFLRVKGLVIERGGALSHCAIVAREMRLPAVSGILNCCEQLKDGQKIWVDGNRGHVQLA
jgi:phosphohistidine swiveling domain-containing protein